MSESSSVDPWSTFLNTTNHGVNVGRDVNVNVNVGADANLAERPEEEHRVLTVLAENRAMEVAELRQAVELSTLALVRLLATLEGKGQVRILSDGGDDIAVITTAGREALDQGGES
ncbi:MAG: hypothetical protein HOV94_08375 [Saccharothrix sp.]|nr:hypothetical protein [Saccharothrix sp.]